MKVLGAVPMPAEIEELFVMNDPDGRMVFRITGDGVFELGEDWSHQDAAKHFTLALNQMFEETGMFDAAWADYKATKDRLERILERLGSLEQQLIDPGIAYEAAFASLQDVVLRA